MPGNKASKPLVVVVGAGFGGINAVRQLAGEPVRVLLIDRHNYHLFLPLMYQVASALLDPSEIARPVRAIVRQYPSVDFRLASVLKINLDQCLVTTDHGEVAYDYLILAAGSANNYFGNRTLEEASFSLKDLDSGLALRKRILEQFEAAAWARTPDEKEVLLRFAIVGGGPTGVEYSGALSELVRLVLRKDFHLRPSQQVQILLIEGSDELLPGFEPRPRQFARRALEHKGVTVWRNALVKSIDGITLKLSDGRIVQAGTIIWTAGVRGAEIGHTLGVSLGHQQTVKVEPTLQLPGHSEVFVIGDLAEVVQDMGIGFRCWLPWLSRKAGMPPGTSRRLFKTSRSAPFATATGE